ncbi:hypothetical protein B0H17DRAFT_1069589 [Mycena rosella]|uniref:F-box domain-containing protein n=1 Tax=Mycena rosella TaxID=1033263 RepID=A0AAD7DBZ1_MYCRO|nr:hypothetical protein B0H17DRAFT_1069589 [Mycena rosella]
MKRKGNKRLKSAVDPLEDAAPAPPGNIFAGMSLDIILQFLLFVSPAELLALHDVNKWFHCMLHGKKVTVARIWVQSREYHGIPAPFEGFDERAWAQLIFGRVCQECGENEAREPDFRLMMRLCAKCRTENLCQEIDFSEDSDEAEHMGPIVEFDETFLHSKWEESRKEILADDYDSYHETHWWAPYCFDMVPIIRDARRGRPGAQKKLTKLYKEGKQRLAHSIICDQWRDRVERAERQTKLDALKDKFKALGYLDPELSGLQVDDRKMIAQFDLPISEPAWEVMRTALESSVKDKRRDRLIKDHPDIMKGRQVLAREAYVVYASTVVPKDAPYLPTLEGLDAIPEIRAICERERDVDINSADFAGLPSIVTDWVNTKRAKLSELANSRAVPEMTTDRFNLASTIFRCKIEHDPLGRPPMFGGDEAMRHVGETCDPQFDKPLSNIAAALVVSLGLNVNAVSVADMDRRNARFRCDGRGSYGVCGERNKVTIEVFTWRGCINHAIEVHKYGSKETDPSWGTTDGERYRTEGNAHFSVASEDLAAQARGASTDDSPKAESTSWVCGHCTMHACAPETLHGVTAHVSAIHGKSQLGASDILFAPGVLFINKGCYSVPRPVATQAQPAVATMFRCLRCNKTKTFRGGPVRDHLKGKHQILDAVLDVDYEVAI